MPLGDGNSSYVRGSDVDGYYLEPNLLSSESSICIARISCISVTSSSLNMGTGDSPRLSSNVLVGARIIRNGIEPSLLERYSRHSLDLRMTRELVVVAGYKRVTRGLRIGRTMLAFGPWPHGFWGLVIGIYVD